MCFRHTTNDTNIVIKYQIDVVVFMENFLPSEHTKKINFHKIIFKLTPDALDCGKLSAKIVLKISTWEYQKKVYGIYKLETIDTCICCCNSTWTKKFHCIIYFWMSCIFGLEKKLKVLKITQKQPKYVQ